MSSSPAPSDRHAHVAASTVAALYVDGSGRPTGEPIVLSRCETHPLPESRFKVWATGLNNWHVHAKHPTTGAWIAAHGLYSETAAMLKGDSFCDKLDAEAERAAA